MVFASLAFLWVFLPLVLGLYFASRSLVWRDAVLVVVSLIFYGWASHGLWR